MPIIRVVVLAVAKTFSKLFGLATITFFGRAPTRDDDKLGAVGVIALTWLFTAVAVVVPEVAEMVVPFLPDDEVILRGTAIALTVALPLIVGWLISGVQNQPKGAGSRLANILRGYGYTPLVGLLTVALILVVPMVKIAYLARRYELQHLAVMIADDTYDQARDHMGELLERHDIPHELTLHPWVVRRLFTWMAWTEGHIFRRGMQTRMQRFTGQVNGKHYELTVHATDLSVLGESEAVSCVFALMAEELDPRVVYLTWDDASQAVEDDIRECYDQIDAGTPCDRDHLEELADRLRDLALGPPEWNAVRRMIYRVAVRSEQIRADEASTGVTSASAP